mmetsp:Transcript_55246/g.167949  ORF Transcript_55246/g.167949 Transcript_55246/m.167949 type:complete len:253 (+) Transcript_55246:1005-1763(+)
MTGAGQVHVEVHALDVQPDREVVHDSGADDRPQLHHHLPGALLARDLEPPGLHVQLIHSPLPVEFPLISIVDLLEQEAEAEKLHEGEHQEPVHPEVDAGAAVLHLGLELIGFLAVGGLFDLLVLQPARPHALADAEAAAAEGAHQRQDDGDHEDGEAAVAHRHVPAKHPHFREIRHLERIIAHLRRILGLERVVACDVEVFEIHWDGDVLGELHEPRSLPGFGLRGHGERRDRFMAVAPDPPKGHVGARARH